MFCVCSATWACVQCKTLYDLEEIEQSLLDAVHRKSMAYVLQDLECEKCHGVSQLISVFIEHKKKYCLQIQEIVIIVRLFNPLSSV